MNGWQEPKDGKRIYIITDNTKMNGFIDYIKSEDVDRLYVTYSESRVNLGIHYYRNKLYTSNLVGICRIKSVDNETLYDAEGNELLIKVIPRFNVKIVELLNYMRDDDEFDRYMAPQTISNRHKERDIEAIDRNEIFYFFGNENPLKVDDKISGENSIITVTVFLTLLRLLCKKPLMGRMLKEEKNLTGKVKGKIVIEKNIRANTMHGRNDRFYCQYLQFSEDIIENQILKAALKKSKRFVIEYFKGWGKDNNNYTSMISYCSNALRNISDIQCDGEACNGLKFSGCYIYYKPVMAMAKMVLDDISIESNGDVSTTGYILPYAISMEKLFEVYVRAYFKKNGIACDILRKVSMSTDLSKIGEPDEYLLVLTPSCDLVNEGIRNAKVEEVLCAKCFDKEVFSGDVRKAGKIESLLNSGVNKQWVALPAYKNICPSLTVDMKKLEIIPLSKVIMDIKELKENNTYLRICSVDSPFREQIIWNYMQTSCRPGVPDRNVTAWAKDIANIKK